MADGPKARIMVDTTVLIAGSGWPRWPREVLLAGLHTQVQLALSPYVLEQAYRILNSRFPNHIPRFEEFMATTPFELIPDPSAEDITLRKGLVRDETDLPIVLAAINAGVDYLISEIKI